MAWGCCVIRDCVVQLQQDEPHGFASTGSSICLLLSHTAAAVDSALAGKRNRACRWWWWCCCCWARARHSPAFHARLASRCLVCSRSAAELPTVRMLLAANKCKHTLFIMQLLSCWSANSAHAAGCCSRTIPTALQQTHHCIRQPAQQLGLVDCCDGDLIECAVCCCCGIVQLGAVM